ncbi:uncharacterized protein LOC105684001 isoform X2 [Athalia rosae]|uniref:uncharacterized protein LOC105684001 isoform X2 n=1 Tax=Athalia rosae TaxID=37344 RepID=UPI00203369A3|nr:uncharacterized protein LOC105684001 isoform X2 [Athalia rosae]
MPRYALFSVRVERRQTLARTINFISSLVPRFIVQRSYLSDVAPDNDVTIWSTARDRCCFDTPRSLLGDPLAVNFNRWCDSTVVMKFGEESVVCVASLHPGADDVEVFLKPEDGVKEEPDERWKRALDQLLVDDSSFVYRGEGNANVVLALPRERRVLRLRKSPPGETSTDAGRARAVREIEFLRNVISGFLGGYVQPPEMLCGTPEDMIKLSEAIRPLRPEHRRIKDVVEEYVTKYLDYAFLPEVLRSVGHPKRSTFSVEIKPKQGFRHELDEPFEKCTYCLTQYYKLKRGEITSRSNYCPFDLFSGDTERMRKAILELLRSPQNNLKIFRNGVVVYDSKSNFDDLRTIFAEWFAAEASRSFEQILEIFLRLVACTLLRGFSHGELSPPPVRRTLDIRGIESIVSHATPRLDPKILSKARKLLRSSGDMCNFEGGQLPSASVLARILQMQRLPYHGVDSVYGIYSKHSATLNDELVYSGMRKIHDGKKSTDDRFNGQDKREVEEEVVILTDTGNRDDIATSKPSANRSINRIPDRNGNRNDRSTDDRVFIGECSPLDKRNNNAEERREEIGDRTGSSITDFELEILRNYLIVTTAKDCSVLMAFQEVETTSISGVPAEFIIDATDRLNFAVNVGVLDLDPKSIHCVQKHRQRDNDVLVSLGDALEEEIADGNQLPFGHN